MDIYLRNGGKGDKNHRNRKRLSKTDIGIPQDFVHVATVKSPTKTEVNFNDALISEFLQRAEVSVAALSDPETQQCIKDFIQNVGLDAIHREIYQTKAEVFTNINTENEQGDIHHTSEGKFHSSQIQSNDNSSIEFIPDHDIEITSEIDDVFTESDISVASPTTPNQKDSKLPSDAELKHSPEGARESQSQLESEGLQTSSNPKDSDHTQELVSDNGVKRPRKKPDHDNFLRELKDAIKKRNTRLKKRAADEMKKSEDGWSKWNSPTKSKSYVSFFHLDSPPENSTRTLHTFWDLTTHSHHNSETDFNDDQASDTKDIDSPDGKKISPNNVKLPLTKRTGAITKMASSEEIRNMKLLLSEESAKDSKTSTSTEANEEGSVQKMKQDESNKENIPAESANQPASGTLNEDICKREENNSEIPEGNEDSRSELNKEKSQKKNITSWFSRKNQNKAANKATIEGLPTEERKATSEEKGNGNDPDMNASSNNKGEEKKMLSIFSSLTKKKQTKEESPTNVGNEKITPEEQKDQQKNKTVSSSKFRLFGSSERLLDSEKKETDNKKEEELQTTVTPPIQNDNSIAVTHTAEGKMESSSEATENSSDQKNDIKSQEKQTSNSEEDEKSKKEDTSLIKSKSKSTSMKNLFFSSGKLSKQKVEKNKEEDPVLEKKELANISTPNTICKDDEDDAVNKKRSGIINLLFTPPEKRSKQKDGRTKQNSEKEEQRNEKDTENTSTGAEFFVEIPLSDNTAEFQDEMKEQELSMEEVNVVGDIDEPSNEESRNMSPKKTKSKMNFLFTSGKQSKNKPEERNEEAPKVKQQVANEKAAESIQEEDRYGSWDKSKHSAFVNLLFAPPERHAKKAKPKEKIHDNKGQEGLLTGEGDQNGEMSHNEEKESSSDKKESFVENGSSKSNAELTNEVKQEEKQDAKIKDEAPSFSESQGEMSISKEKREISESEAESSTDIYFPKHVNELKNAAEQDIELREVSSSDLSQDKESNCKRESLENGTECPAEIISSENTNEAIKEVKQDIKSMEEVPIIIVTQDEECICEEEEEILTNKGEVSSEMASAENIIDLKNKNELQEAPMVIKEFHNLITMKEEKSSRVEDKEVSMESREFITEITKCFDEIKDEVKHEGLSEEKPELVLEEDNTNDEKGSTNISTSTTVSAVTISVSFASRDDSKPKTDDKKDENIVEKDLPVTATFEEKNNEEGTKNISKLEKRLSGIIDSLFARPEKHAKPNQDKEKYNSSKNEELCKDTMPQSDESIHKEGSPNKTESTENIIELTNKGEPSEVSEDQPITDTPSDEAPNLGEEMNTSLSTSSSRMHTLFGSTGKHSKPKKNLKQENISKKGELSSTAVAVNEDLKSEEERNSSLDKAKSSSMRKLLFGKRTKPKHEEHRDMLTSGALDDEEKVDEDGYNPTADNKASSIEISPATSEKPTVRKHEVKEQDEPAKGELSSTAVAVNEDLKSEEERNSSLDKAKSSSMRKLLFGKRTKPKHEDHRDMLTSGALDDEEKVDEDGYNPTADNKASSIEISPATSEKPTVRKHEVKEQDEPAKTVEQHEEISEDNKPIQHEEDSKRKRKKNPASRKTGFFSLPDRRGKMRNEVRSQQVAMFKEQPQSELKEINQVEKDSTQGNSSTPRKRGLLSTLDKRKRVKHEARTPEVSLQEKEENSNLIKSGNVEGISSERERPPLRDTETPTSIQAIVEFPNERAVDVGEINDNSYKPKSESKEDLLKSSSYPRRKGKTRTELKKEDISLQKDMRHTTHVTWDPIKKNLVLHYTDNEGLRRILLEETLCKEAPAPRQRRHSYSMAMDDSDGEVFEEIPRASIQSYSSVTSNPKSSGKTRRKVPKARPRSEIVRGNQPLTEL